MAEKLDSSQIENRVRGYRIARELAKQNPDDPTQQELLGMLGKVLEDAGIEIPPEEPDEPAGETTRPPEHE